MVEQIRAKWCEDLEELLQCPVCYERPKVPVLQCLRGHHICNGCKDQMGECPLCKSRFSTARSYLAEELSNKLDEIKLSLLHPNHVLNHKDVSTVGSQTDGPTIIDRNDAKRAKRAPPPAPKGKFPCRLGACDVVLPHGRMIPHIRYYHGNKFYESSSTGADTYRQAWEIDYDDNTSFDLAIRVAEMGLFFMRIKINQNGDLFGVVQIVSTNTIGKEFEYELKVESGQRSSSFKEDVRSCRTNPIYLFEAKDCLVVKSEDMQRMIASNDHTFSCTMILNRLQKSNDKKPPINNSLLAF